MRKIQPGTHGTCPWTSLAMAGLLASGVWGPAIAQDAWSLGPPIARIGEGQTPEYELDRVASLLVRGERLYVADRSQQIRAYDLTTGTIIAVGGGSGQGPGEFRALDWIDDCNSDQLFASDGIQDRISVFSLALEHIRTFRLGRDAWLRSARCAGPDGFIGVHGKESEGATEIPPGPYRMAVELSIFFLLGSPNTWLTAEHLRRIPWRRQIPRGGKRRASTMGKDTSAGVIARRIRSGNERIMVSHTPRRARKRH